jgi:hypothetical protein
MSDDPGAIDKAWDGLPGYGDRSGDADDAVTLSISTTPGEWLVNTVDAVVVPMSMIEVVEALRSHKLTERSLVWRAGMQEWAPVQKVPQLTLAARMPSVAPQASSPPPRSSPATKPPPKPVRAAPTPAPAVVLPSRKATLPFGLPSPLTAHSKPPGSKPFHPSPSPRPALAPPPSPEDTEVLAVYDRPAATISFDLSPEVPLRTLSAPAPTPPQTLAPTTTDSAPRRGAFPPPRNADLSVVAASQFRQAQQFSKRLILLSSLGSAAVASLLTLWLSPHREAPHVAAPPPAQTVPAATSAAAPPPVVQPAPPEPVAVADAPPAEPSAKPKPKHKPRAKAWRPPRPAEPATATSMASTPVPAEPGNEANPYDVRLEEDTSTQAKPPTPSHGSGLEAETAPREETATTTPTSPGF